MKTADLIAALSADCHAVSSGSAARRFAAPVLAGVLVAAMMVILWLGRRSLTEATQTFPFWMKAAYTVALSSAATWLVTQISMPGKRVGRGPWLVVGAALAVMLILAARELMTTAPAERAALWRGGSWNVCPFRILALSAPIYLGLLVGMRQLAPTRPFMAGGAAGFLAGALGATVYQLFCPETGAMFLVTWYTLGILASTVIGALVGHRALRW